LWHIKTVVLVFLLYGVVDPAVPLSIVRGLLFHVVVIGVPQLEFIGKPTQLKQVASQPQLNFKSLVDLHKKQLCCGQFSQLQ
jgi:hypothetical protein